MDEPLASARESLLKAIRVTADKVCNQDAASKESAETLVTLSTALSQLAWIWWATYSPHPDAATAGEPPPVVKPPQQDVKGIKELTKDLQSEHTVQR